jgi:hypothetical protein
LGRGINLTGRNEVRISGGGNLTLQGGTVSSLRWVDVREGGVLSGTGCIDATLYNRGTVVVPSDVGDGRLKVKSDYIAIGDAELHLRLNHRGRASVVVEGIAELSGSLDVSVLPEIPVKSGQTFTILIANEISGNFLGGRKEITAKDGTRFEINYSNASVTLTAL